MQLYEYICGFTINNTFRMVSNTRARYYVLNMFVMGIHNSDIIGWMIYTLFLQDVAQNLTYSRNLRQQLCALSSVTESLDQSNECVTTKPIILSLWSEAVSMLKPGIAHVPFSTLPACTHQTPDLWHCMALYLITALWQQCHVKSMHRGWECRHQWIHGACASGTMIPLKGETSRCQASFASPIGCNWDVYFYRFLYNSAHYISKRTDHSVSKPKRGRNAFLQF